MMLRAGDSNIFLAAPCGSGAADILIHIQSRADDRESLPTRKSSRRARWS
jgi:hypothetical protein